MADFKIIPSAAHPNFLPIIPEFEDDSREEMDEETVNLKATEFALAEARTNPDFVLDSQERYINQLKRRLRLGQEAQMRREVAANKVQQRIDNTRELLGEIGPIETPEDRQAAISVLTGIDINPDTVVEEEASAAFVEAGAQDPIRAKVMNDEPEEVDQTQLFLYKTARIDSLLTKHRGKFEQQGLAGDAVDFAEMFIPFGIEIFNRRRTGGDILEFNSDNIQNWRLKIFNMSKEEFDAEMEALDRSMEEGGLFGPNRLLNQQLIEQLRSFKKSDEFIADLGLVLDTASFLPVGTAIKLLKQPATAARIAGNRTAAATITEQGTEALQTTTQTVTKNQTKDIYTNLLPSEAQTQNLIGPNTSGEVAKRLEQKAVERAQLGQEVIEAPRVSRLNEDQLVAARTEAENRLRLAAGDNHIVDFGREEIGNAEVRVAYIGQVKDKNAGYAREIAARKAGVRRGLLERDFEVVKRSGQYFIALKEPIIETERSIRMMGKIDPNKIPIANRLLRYIQGADSQLDNVTKGRRHLAAGVQAKVNQVFKQATQDLRSVSRKERRNLNQVLRHSEENQKWLNTDELSIYWKREFDRAPSEKEINAYYAAKDISDIDWYLHNTDLHARLSRDGYKKVELQMGKLKFDDHPDGAFVGNAKIHEVTADNVSNKYIYDASSGMLRRPGSIDADEIARLQEEGWQLLQVQNVEDIARGVGSRVDFVLTHPENMRQGLIDFIQLPYVQGGHRIYEGKFFIKQGRSLVDRQTGKEFLMRPHTHFVAGTRGEATEIAGRWEAARTAYRDAVAGRIEQGEATAIIQENTNLRDFSHFDRMVKEGQIDPKQKFEAVDNRQLPSVYQGRDTDFLGTFEDADDLQEWMNTSGRLIYGRKGERLKDGADNYAPTVDPFDAISTGLKHAITTRAFSDLTTNVVESWISTFQKYLDDFPKDWSRAQIFNRGKLRDDVPEAIKAKAEAMRASHKQLLGTPTKATLWWKESVDQLIDKIEEIGGTRGREVARRLHNTKSRDPITALRSMAFDLKLGLFDPSQILIQSQTAFAALSLDTVNGLAGFRAYGPLRYALYNGSDEVVDYIAKNFKPLHGLEPDDFKELLTDLRRSGMADISGNLAILDELSSTHLVNMATNPIARVRELGRIPFFEGERINRIVAFTMAWRRFKKANPGVKLTDRLMEQVRLEADTFAVNMDRASNAWWQKGILSVPTQFMSYQARLIELMLPKMLGGSPNLRAQQKLRLAMGQFFLYGTAGVPLAGYIKKQFEEKTGRELDPETEELLFQGFWDNAIFGTLGMDTDFSARAGVWGGRNLFTDMIEGRSFFEIAGGPPAQVGSEVVQTISRLAQLRHLSLEDAARVTPSMLNEIAKNAASWSRASRAWYAFRTGQYLSNRSGSVITDGVNTQEAIAVLLGIPLEDVNIYYEMKGDLRDQQQAIQDAADFTSRRLGEMYRMEVDGDTRGAEAMAKQIAAFLAPFDGRERSRIISIATKNASTDLGDVMGQYIESKGLDTLVKRAQINDGSPE